MENTEEEDCTCPDINLLPYEGTDGSVATHAVQIAFSQSSMTPVDDGRPVDYRLEDVINRYEARVSASQDEIELPQEIVLRNEVIVPLAECAMEMPSEEDPGLWRVRVRVSAFLLSCFAINWLMTKNGTEEESFFLLCDRLKARRQWGISVVLPPGAKEWICVESQSRENVEKLCIHLSTFRHPLQIIFVPVRERLQWLNWQHHQTQRITAPAWVRIKNKSILKELLLSSGSKYDKRVLNYANDLAYVPWSNESWVFIWIVPRLPLPISNGDLEGESKRGPKTKQMQRLLHPMMLGDPLEATRGMSVAHMIDPSVWWKPKTRYELENVGPGTFQLANPKSKRKVMGGETYVLPFAFYAVPPAALQSAGVVPRLSELKTFGEGFAIGSKELNFPGPDLEFLRWTYENHIAARVEIGQKVEAKVDGGMVRGVIKDQFINEVTLRLNDAEEILVDVHCVRRFYDVGDKVKVVKASFLNREGLVVDIQDGRIEVFDYNEKEHVSLFFRADMID